MMTEIRRAAMMRSFAILLAGAAVPASAQPKTGSASVETASLQLRTCLRANAPEARSYVGTDTDVAVMFLGGLCYSPFSETLTSLGEGEAVWGSYQRIAREEWNAFKASLKSR